MDGTSGSIATSANACDARDGAWSSTARQTPFPTNRRARPEQRIGVVDSTSKFLRAVHVTDGWRYSKPCCQAVKPDTAVGPLRWSHSPCYLPSVYCLLPATYPRYEYERMSTPRADA